MDGKKRIEDEGCVSLSVCDSNKLFSVFSISV